MAATGRACGALSLEEEKHVLLAKAHLALAAKCRVNSVEETREAVAEACDSHDQATKELRLMVNTASMEIRSDKAAMLVVVSADGSSLRVCSLELRSDPEIILAACEENGHAFQYVHPDLQGDRDLRLQAIRLNGYALDMASPDLRSDREIVTVALQSHPAALIRASVELIQDRDLILEALRLQTRRQVFIEGSSVLQDVKGWTSDKELVLEAARVDGCALKCATQELRNDKDFVLEVMRRAPREDQEMCYNEADPEVQDDKTLEEFQGACNSVLAHTGEDVPVLTVTMQSEAAGPPGSKNDQGPASCEVALLSGASFACCLDAPLPGETPLLQPESLTVGHLAQIVRAKLAAQMQDAPARVFIVFAKPDPEGGEAVSNPVSPWDWNRPVADFS